MKIEFVPSFSRETKSKNVKRAKKSFIDLLKNVEEENHSELVEDFDFEELIESDIKEIPGIIERLGERLSENPTLKNFNTYKMAIKLLLEAIKKNFESRETLSRVSFSKQKLYKTVEIIDRNLAELAELILNQERDRLTYLKLLQNIKGLVVDLLL